MNIAVVEAYMCGSWAHISELVVSGSDAVDKLKAHMERDEYISANGRWSGSRWKSTGMHPGDGGFTPDKLIGWMIQSGYRLDHFSTPYHKPLRVHAYIFRRND
eukprot:scaffold28921_cov191-Amphora_coffeaeformis.AAC.5